MWTSQRPESNKENVVPSSVPYGAPSASSFVTSGGQTKITEESHYQQIKSSVVRSECPAAPAAVVKHETTKTETITTSGKIPSSAEAFQSPVPQPVSGVSKMKQQEVTEHSSYQQIQSATVSSNQAQMPQLLRTEAPASQIKPNAEKLLPLCVEAFQDSVLSPISGIKKTKQEVTETSYRQQTYSSLSHSGAAQFAQSAPKPSMVPTQAKPPGEKLIPMCVEAFQDSVLSPISGIKKTKTQEVTASPQEAKSTVFQSMMPSFTQSSELSKAHKPVPVSSEVFRASVVSPVGGISRTKTEEVMQDGRKTEKTTTETIQETKGSCQTTILRKEKESVVRDSFVTQNRPIFRATPLTAAISQPSTIKTARFETQTSETKQKLWKPTGAVAEKVKGYSPTQPAFSATSVQKSVTTSSNIKPRPLSCPDSSIFDLQKMKKETVMTGTANRPVAPVAESMVSRNVYQGDKESSTLPRRNEYDSRISSGGFASPDPQLMPSVPYGSAPSTKPSSFQNFNTTAKSWNEAKRSDSSQSPGFKPVRPPTFYTK